MEGAVRAMSVVIYMLEAQAQSEMGLRRQHAKVQQDERGGRGAPCVRCDEGANARAHVARWRGLPRALRSETRRFSCFRLELSLLLRRLAPQKRGVFVRKSVGTLHTHFAAQRIGWENEGGKGGQEVSQNTLLLS